jgi:hypothetical protein
MPPARSQGQCQGASTTLFFPIALTDPEELEERELEERGESFEF